MNEQEIGMMVLFTTLIILLFVAGIVIVVVKARHEKTRKDVELATMQLTYQAELSKTQLEVGEQVMTNIAREMHDNIGQLLTYLYLQIENKKNDDDKLNDILTPLTGTVTLITEQVRLLSHSLNTDHINKLGLLEGIRSEVLRLEKLGYLKVHFVDDGFGLSLDKDRQLIAFRIFQEAVNNILKHSGASEMSIELTAQPQFILKISDNGQGFNVSEKYGGTGLANMLKRAALAKFQLDIISEPGNGCTYILKC